MVHVVTDACASCLHLECVEVCPVQCFFRTENQLVIDGFECVNCGACVPICPVDAIAPEERLQPHQQWLVAWNTEQAQSVQRAGR